MTTHVCNNCRHMSLCGFSETFDHNWVCDYWEERPLEVARVWKIEVERDVITRYEFRWGSDGSCSFQKLIIDGGVAKHSPWIRLPQRWIATDYQELKQMDVLFQRLQAKGWEYKWQEPPDIYGEKERHEH